MSEGQKLRWWQEEEPQGQARAASEAVERVAVSPTPLVPETVRPQAATAEPSASENDTWAELEAEAARRVVQAKVEASESVSFYMDKPAILARHRFWARFFQVLCAICLMPFLFFLGWLAYWEWNFLHRLNPLNYLVPSFLMLGSMLPLLASIPGKTQYRQLLQKESPMIRLAPQGIFIERPLRKDEYLPWVDVAGVKPCRLMRHRYLEIKTVSRRVITVEQQDLVASVDTVATQVAAYKTVREIA